MCMHCCCGRHPYDYVLEQATLAAEAAKTAQLPVVDRCGRLPAWLLRLAARAPTHAMRTRLAACRSPVKEVVYGIRAISPLIVVLVLLNVVVIRMPLPLRGFLPEDDDDTSLASTEPSVHGSSGGGGDDNKDVQALPEAAHKQGKVRPRCCSRGLAAEAARVLRTSACACCRRRLAVQPAPRRRTSTRRPACLRRRRLTTASSRPRAARPPPP